MQVQVIEGNDILRLEKCRHCTNKVRPGQAVLVHHGYDESYVRRDFVIHVRCVRRVLLDAPADVDQEAFHELRAEILRTGQAFPVEEKCAS